jgi:hemolysin III
LKRQTTGEEIANSVTHALGALLAVAALAILVTLAALQGDAWRVVSLAIYGATLVIL